MTNRIVVKRDGDLEEFDILKIDKAVGSAMFSAGCSEPNSRYLVADSVAVQLEFDDDWPIAVDDIHKLIEDTLMDHKMYDTAREYITYRKDHEHNIFRKRVEIEPKEYRFCEDFITGIQHSYWLHTEFSSLFPADIHDMRSNMSKQDSNIVTRAMLAISQIENAVKKFWGNIGDHMPKPEISDVGMVFSESEVRHKRAYAHLLEELGLQEEFKKLQDVPAMQARIKYLDRINSLTNSDDPKEYFEAILLFSMFVENVSLFSQFLIIMAYNKYQNTLKGMSNIIEATSKEENLHAQFGFQLINTIKEENPDWWTDALIDRIDDLLMDALEAEESIVDWIYEEGEGTILPKYLVQDFLVIRLNQSLEAIGLDPIGFSDVSKEQLQWFDDELSGTKNNDFFSKRSVAYTKRNKSVTAEDIF